MTSPESLLYKPWCNTIKVDTPYLLLIQVGALVAAQCDAYVHGQVPAFAKDKCQTIVRGSKHHACRLLHYFAFADATSIPQDLDSWCGWHNDHCTLTSLMPAMYHDKDGTPIPCPDKEAGLYIKSRNGDLVHVAYVRFERKSLYPTAVSVNASMVDSFGNGNIDIWKTWPSTRPAGHFPPLCTH